MHTLFIGLVVRVYQRLPFEGMLQFVGLIAIVMVGSTIVGIIVHRLIEKPLTSALTRRFARSPKVATPP